MNKLLTLAIAGLMSVSVIGCHASAEVDKPDSSGGKTTVKKTTVEPDGDKKTTTETKTY